MYQSGVVFKYQDAIKDELRQDLKKINDINDIQVEVHTYYPFIFVARIFVSTMKLYFRKN